MNEQMTMRAARAVVARQADNQKTNNEGTNKRRTKDEQKTNKRRTMNEAKLKLRQSYNLRKLNINCFFKVIKLWKKRNDFRVFMIFRL